MDNRSKGQPAPGVVRIPLSIVNAYLVRDAGPDAPWVLIDAGLATSAGGIARAARTRFGRDARPLAILLTHGHFDHVGALAALARAWDAPVYAHASELPYLRGERAYPPPDSRAGGGAMSLLSPLYPRGPLDLGTRVTALPEGTVPGLPSWRWIHTPGHTAGHVSFFRDFDRVLIVGDAFVTQRQESAWSVLTRRPEVSRPPAYFTTDWGAARESVARLEALHPEVAATGHGVPMRGEPLREGLGMLVREWARVAVPANGRYGPTA